MLMGDAIPGEGIGPLFGFEYNVALLFVLFQSE
jgi:hypothetical protein